MRTESYLKQVKIFEIYNSESSSHTLGMSSYARRMFGEGSIVQHQLVHGRWVLCTYGTERMKELAEQAENESLLQLPDELFSPGSAWQELLEEDRIIQALPSIRI